MIVSQILYHCTPLEAELNKCMTTKSLLVLYSNWLEMSVLTAARHEQAVSASFLHTNSSTTCLLTKSLVHLPTLIFTGTDGSCRNITKSFFFIKKMPPQIDYYCLHNFIHWQTETNAYIPTHQVHMPRLVLQGVAPISGQLPVHGARTRNWSVTSQSQE